MNDREASVRFYTEIMGFGHDGEDGPFSVIRVSPGDHAPARPLGHRGRRAPGLRPLTRGVRRHLRPRAGAGLPFGDSFHDVGNMQGPGAEAGRAGSGPTVYLFDPNGHLVELRHY